LDGADNVALNAVTLPDGRVVTHAQAFPAERQADAARDRGRDGRHEGGAMSALHVFEGVGGVATFVAAFTWLLVKAADATQPNEKEDQ
jgi:hypothetical protein